jgi:hypothetical protein
MMWLWKRPAPLRPGSRLVPPAPTAAFRSGHRVLVFNLAGFATLASLVASASTSSRPEPVAAALGEFSAVVQSELASVPDAPPAAECAESAEELDLRSRLIGAWEDDYMGHRVLTLRPDGTGTMQLELRGPAKLIVGKRLSFRLTWTTTDDVLTLKMTGGEPANKVAMITRTYGDSAIQSVELIDGRTLLVRDLDDGDEYEFRRLEPTITQVD